MGPGTAVLPGPKPSLSRQISVFFSFLSTVLMLSYMLCYCYDSFSAAKI
jgi:hypothetical protein